MSVLFGSVGYLDFSVLSLVVMLARVVSKLIIWPALYPRVSAGMRKRRSAVTFTFILGSVKCLLIQGGAGFVSYGCGLMWKPSGSRCVAGGVYFR